MKIGQYKIILKYKIKDLVEEMELVLFHNFDFRFYLCWLEYLPRTICDPALIVPTWLEFTGEQQMYRQF